MPSACAIPGATAVVNSSPAASSTAISALAVASDSSDSSGRKSVIISSNAGPTANRLLISVTTMKTMPTRITNPAEILRGRAHTPEPRRRIPVPCRHCRTSALVATDARTRSSPMCRTLTTLPLARSQAEYPRTVTALLLDIPDDGRIGDVLEPDLTACQKDVVLGPGHLDLPDLLCPTLVDGRRRGENPAGAV